MTKTRLVAGLAVAFLSGAAGESTSVLPVPGTNCEGLTALVLTNVKIMAATSVPAGPFRIPGARAGAAPVTLPAFCRFVAVATPSSDSTINFEVWMPPASS